MCADYGIKINVSRTEKKNKKNFTIQLIDNHAFLDTSEKSTEIKLISVD